MGAVTILVLEFMSLAAVILLLTAALHREDDIPKSIVMLVSAIIATRVDAMKIQRIAVAALFKYLVRRRANDDGNNIKKSKIARVIKHGKDHRMKAMFRLSKPVFHALVRKLRPWLEDGQSRNQRQNLPAAVKVGIALYYMAHGGSGKNLAYMSDVEPCTALKYLHEVAELIVLKVSPDFMGEALYKQEGYMLNCRERYQARRAVPWVSLCVDGSHIPYVPNSGENDTDFKNYKGWCSLLCIGFVNSYHCFVDLDVAWPGSRHDKFCTDFSGFWARVLANRDFWLGINGIVLADSAWGYGSEVVMTPFTANNGLTSERQWFNFVHSSTRFFVEETLEESLQVSAQQDVLFSRSLQKYNFCYSCIA